VRAASLALFDRTFAVTYALEIAAIAIGLIGVSVSFSAQALARRREFGVLRHIGMTRLQIAAMLGIEGALLSALGVAFGVATGWVISVILVHVINRQSFHWSMETSLPLSSLTALSGAIVAASAVTAIVSARAAMREEVVRAVREDW
jgi:putative ABC transport system permease protein